MAITKKGGKKGSPSWLKKGGAAKEAVVKEEALATARREAAGKAWRFRIPKTQLNEDFSVTFLDGDVEDGVLDVPVFYEHRIMYNGNWDSFTCVSDEEDCPLCAENNRTTLVGVMTVIDHTPYEAKDGKVFRDRIRLFVATPQTLKLLTRIAIKRDGLTGATLTITRTSDTDPAVGSIFEFEEKRSMEELAKLFPQKDKEGKVLPFGPLNYEEEIPYRDAEELIKMGLGKHVHGVGGKKEVADEDTASQL